MLRKLIIAGSLLLASGWAVPALAKSAQTSFCRVDELSRSELAEIRDAFLEGGSLADIRGGFFSRTNSELGHLVDRIADECAEKAGKDAAAKPTFGDFVRWDTLTFAFRDSLIAQGFDADALDRRIDMPCKLSLFPKGAELPIDGAELIRKAFADAGRPLEGLDEDEMRLGVLYVAASSEYWRQGLKLGLLPQCSAKP